MTEILMINLPPPNSEKSALFSCIIPVQFSTVYPSIYLLSNVYVSYYYTIYPSRYCRSPLYPLQSYYSTVYPSIYWLKSLNDIKY